MSAPKLISVSAVVECECGEEHEFDELEDGWTTIITCDCGRRVSVSVETLLQYDTQICVHEQRELA